MTENIMLERINAANSIYRNTYDSSAVKTNNEEDTSIFSSLNETEGNKEENIEALEAQLAAIQANNGAILDGWNNFKEKIGVGTSAEKCDKAIEQYQNGEITYEEAEQIINKFGAKQDSSLNLFSNIVTSIAAIGAVAAATAITAASGGFLAPEAAVVIGAATGALTKSGFKTADRATNEVEGDALDAKEMAKDALSGAVTGGVAVCSMGTAGNPFKNGFKIGEKEIFSGGTKACIAKCAETGLKTGAISGSANYGIDCAFDEDKEFDAGEFLLTTAESAIVGGAVGAVMGGVNGQLRASGLLNSGCSYKDMISPSETTGINDVAANSACTTAYKVLNDRIRSVAA